jgi:hypothetical protein
MTGSSILLACYLLATANQGFTIGPDSSATEVLKETGENEFARRPAHTERIRMEEAVEFA